ncbi:MAG: hypothetical protein QGF68_05595, partial [Nitrospinota bacterium]|nr:hypothetical protein [Nitrospinota bacterium]
ESWPKHQPIGVFPQPAIFHYRRKWNGVSVTVDPRRTRRPEPGFCRATVPLFLRFRVVTCPVTRVRRPRLFSAL